MERMIRDGESEPVYEPPTVEVVGTLGEVTQGSADGDFLDADFPVGTPKGDLTFS